jgi:hypothetical protein
MEEFICCIASSPGSGDFQALIDSEQLDYNFLFRWFVWLSSDDPMWDAATFTKNRERSLEGREGQGLFHRGSLEPASARSLLNDRTPQLDRRLAWVGHESFKRKDARQTTSMRPAEPDGKTAESITSFLRRPL